MTATEDAHDPLEGIDVLAVFEKDMGEDLPDPHPVYEALREHGPVYAGDTVTDLFGMRSVMSFWDQPSFTVLGYEECAQVLRDAEHFSNTVLQRSVEKTMGRNILTMDDPDHRVNRMLIQHAFTKRAMDDWREDFVVPLVGEAIDLMFDDGAAELMGEFCIRFPVTVIHRILGLPHERLMELHTLAVGLLLYRRPEISSECSKRLGAMLGEYVRERRAEPGSDVISALCTARLDTGETLTDDEIVAFLRVLMPAGGETTTRLTGSLFAHLLTDPEQLALLRSDRSRMGWAIEEALRLEAPTQYVWRLCVRDTELNGTKIPAGSPIGVCLAAANRDPARFTDPERFDITRSTPHLSFGLGPHMCLGMHMARMEVAVAIDAFLDHMPNLRLDPDFAPPHTRGISFCSPAAVHARWD